MSETFFAILFYFYLLISRKTTNFAFVINLDRHIEILLLKYECVIVPGLGGFMAHHVEARYDENEGVFLPPLRTLGFNPQLKLNDSLLAQSYVEAYDISYPEAVDRIESEVNELKQHIQNEGSYELKDIGALSLNDDGNYMFEPCEAGVLTPWLYGLGAFEMKRQAQASRPEETKAPTEAKPKHEIHAHKSTKSSADNSKGKSADVIQIKVAWVRNAVAVAVAVIAFFLITPTISNSYSPNTNIAGIHETLLTGVLAQMPGESQTTEKPVPTKAPASTQTTETAEAKPTAQPTKAIETRTAAESAEGKYCIVLASRITKANAEAFVKELKANGVEEAKVYTSNGTTRVVYGSYESESDAYDTLRTVRDNKYFEQAWVYKKR